MTKIRKTIKTRVNGQQDMVATKQQWREYFIRRVALLERRL